MRSGGTDTQLEEMIKNIWQARADKYSEERSDSVITNSPAPKIEMYQIGG